MTLALQDHECPHLPRGVRIQHDRIRGRTVLMAPEKVIELDRTIDMAVALGAGRLEVACIQFHGWALKNRAAPLLTREQTIAVTDTVTQAARRLQSVLARDAGATDPVCRRSPVHDKIATVLHDLPAERDQDLTYPKA